jgi:hypothetical protein
MEELRIDEGFLVVDEGYQQTGTFYGNKEEAKNEALGRLKQGGLRGPVLLVPATRVSDLNARQVRWHQMKNHLSDGLITA